MKQRPERKWNHAVQLRPASVEEAGLFYSQVEEDRDWHSGTVGHVRMDFGHGGKEFWHTWWPHNQDQFNTPEFKETLQTVVDALRRDGPLKDLSAMRSYCQQYGGAITEDGENFGYIAETEHYQFCLRCTPVPGHYQGYLGRDECGTPRHAHKRSCNSVGKAFRQNIEGSDPRYSFHHIGTDGQLFVFEAPIDLLSYITMYPDNWQAHSYVACCGTSAIPVLSMLERMSAPKEVYLCLDNDQAGETGSLRMAEKIAEQFNIASNRVLPYHKDWNDDLCAENQEQETMTIGGQT